MLNLDKMTFVGSGETSYPTQVFKCCNFPGMIRMNARQIRTAIEQRI